MSVLLSFDYIYIYIYIHTHTFFLKHLLKPPYMRPLFILIQNKIKKKSYGKWNLGANHTIAILYKACLERRGSRTQNLNSECIIYTDSKIIVLTRNFSRAENSWFIRMSAERIAIYLDLCQQKNYRKKSYILF